MEQKHCIGIEALYRKADSKVLINSEISKAIKVGVRQRLLLLPTLCNVFLENIEAEPLEEKEIGVIVGSRYESE